MAGCCFGKSNVLDDVVLTCLYWPVIFDKYAVVLASQLYAYQQTKSNSLLLFLNVDLSLVFVGFKDPHIYIGQIDLI